MAVRCIVCNEHLSTKNVHVKRCRKCYYDSIGSSPLKPWLNKEWLMAHYYDKKMSFSSIARLCGVKPSTIDHAFTDKFKLKSRERNLRGEKNLCWKGGRTVCNGYVLLYHPEPHARKSRKNYVPEHILVAETSVGRKLTENETVHHKNGIKNDNRPENLQVLSPRNHRCLEHAHEAFSKLLIFGDLAPHLREELYRLFTSFIKERLDISV